MVIEVMVPLQKKILLNIQKFNTTKGQRTVDKVYHVQNANNLDMRLRKFMDSFNGVATKYLQSETIAKLAH